MKLRHLWPTLIFTGLAQAQEDPPVPPAPAPAIPQAGAIEVNGIVAKVNGRVITKNKLAILLRPIYRELAIQFPRRGQEFERQALEARNKVLQELIDREIILSEFQALAKAKGAALPPHAIDQEIRRQIREVHGGDEARFHEELKQSRMSMATFRQIIRDQLIVQAMRAQRFSEAPPPVESEIVAEYNEVKDKMRDTTKDKISYHKIFIPLRDEENPLATPDSQFALAQDLVKQIEGGANIEEIAKKHSRDAFAQEGGAQKEVPRIDLAPEFAAVIFSKKDGELVGPLEDPVGFTIVRIDRIHKGPPPPLSEVRERIEAMVRQKKNSELYNKWIEQKRKTAMIDRKI